MKCVCPPRGLNHECEIHGLNRKPRERTKSGTLKRSKGVKKSTTKQELLEAKWAGIKEGMLHMQRKYEPDGRAHCNECGTAGDARSLDLHHVRSRGQGGAYAAHNAELVCRPCHTRLTGDIQWSAS